MSETPKRTDICLPSEKHVVLTWKVKLGSHVQQGETIAMCCLEEDAEVARSKIASSASTATKSTHKRPKRGRRLIPSPASIAAAKTAKPLPAQPIDSNTTHNLHQKLAERLAKSKPSAAAENKASDETLDDSTPITTEDEHEKATVSATTKKAPKESVQTTPILSPVNGFVHESKDEATNGVIGYIEECLHPGFVGGLCVVCGTAKLEIDGNDNDLSPNSSSLTGNSEPRQKNTLVTVSGGVTVSISQQESQEMAKLDIERLLGIKKLCLVLDLDHTLLHATADPRAQPLCESNDDVRTLRLPIVMEAQPNGQTQPSQQPVFMTHYVKLRPHLKEFLNSVRDAYELSVYTAGTRQYAEEITIILCRHLVGTKLDMLELEKLRYATFVAQQEYETQVRLEKKRKSDSNEGADEGGADSKQAVKRKKVSFGVDEVKTYNTTSSADANAPVEKKTAEVLKTKLDELKAELSKGEEMEKEAQKLRQSIFGSRVVSRTDVGDLGRDVKSLRRIFPCGGTMAAVLDDREDVWANASDNSETTRKGEPPSNLLLVKPYHFSAFQGFADVNNAAGVDLSASNQSTETEENDIQLIWTGQILKDLHTLYYSQQNGTRQTVPQLLSRMRKNVLKGTNLVLSGLVPLNRDVLLPDAPRPTIVRYAESLGAQLQKNVDVSVTHVVAAKDGTDKAIAARKFPRTVLIKPSWLMECYWSMSRRRSLAHLMTPIPSRSSSPVPMPKPAEAAEESSDDEDDLAAEFEEELMNY
ncbi:unnamed protein product [Cylindrotheca closterium]|uniref:protein-serine/threonine phosphatase n=1 Tax=Cylindrotheca closterium TaxID=2856 RepID=A0AAD2FPH3_9STRA|nr:unnamed protein product [Cylindrotheca closterium]